MTVTTLESNLYPLFWPQFALLGRNAAHANSHSSLVHRVCVETEYIGVIWVDIASTQLLDQLLIPRFQHVLP
jgi:hypothetical protein